MKYVVEFSGREPPAAMQSFYIADHRVGLKPNLVLVTHGRKWFETNSWGLKGPEPPLGKRLIAIWGDSVVFGIGSPTWIDFLNDRWEGYHFLNGGLEGNLAHHILTRAIRFNREQAVHANIIFPGWHPSGREGPVNTALEQVLTEGVKQIPNCILVTVPTALNEHVIDKDLSAHRFASDGSVGFSGWARDLQPATMQSIHERLLARNEIIRRVAWKKSIPLLDWYALMRTTSIDDFDADFFDAGHPRPASYPKITQLWSEALKQYL